LWFSDLFRAFGMTGQVYSVDKNPVAMQSPGVTFINGDCYRIEEVLPRQFMESLPRPWLLIEDVHVNTASILRHLIGLMEVGDYLVVEDAETKRPVVRSVLDQQKFCIQVDTKYTDFFGRNATSCVDGVLVRLADDSHPSGSGRGETSLQPVLLSDRIL
jgi:cephalosporin hydroxylase